VTAPPLTDVPVRRKVRHLCSGLLAPSCLLYFSDLRL
jgi:hypothetical protein